MKLCSQCGRPSNYTHNTKMHCGEEFVSIAPQNENGIWRKELRQVFKDYPLCDYCYHFNLDGTEKIWMA